jgi:hypothetical protein
MLRNAERGQHGFGRVDVKEIETDPFNCYYVASR